jgi:hypothetical protein
MLTSLLGIRLVILVGDMVPLPAPYDVTSALQRVVVTNDSNSGDGFQITFALARSGLADYGLLQNGTVAPMKRIVVGVLFGALPQVLIDGVVTHHQFDPGTRPGQATLTVMGRDLTTLMNLEEKNEEFPNQPDFLIATKVLSGYAKYGVITSPKPTTDFPIMLQRIPRQQETDLEFLQRLAQRNGFVFYLEPVTFGVSTAYFGPENRLGLPQPALSVNLGASTNVKSLNFSNDALALLGTRGVFVEPISKQSIPIPALPSLKVPPLAASPSTPNRIRLKRDTANQSPTGAATSALAAATNAPDPVTANGEVDGVRYGHALRARKLVGVRGAGLSYDGFWYVRSVTHTVSRTDYSQSFQLSREGTLALTPVVPA